MKKVKYVFALLLVSMVALTGCGKKNSLSPEEILEKAISNIKIYENYKIDLDLNLGLKTNGISIDMIISGIFNVDIKNGINQIDMSVDVFGTTVETEMYTDSKSNEGKIITYTKETDGNWSKETKNDTNENITNSLLNIINSGEQLKELESDKENYNLEITINAEKLQDLMTMTDDSLVDIEANNFAGDLTLLLSIDKDTYNFSKISIEMLDLMNSSLNGDGEITKAEFIMNFSEYGKVGKLEIPSDVIENATEESDSDINSGFVFEEENYEKILSCSLVETEDGAEKTTDILVGFNNNISMAGYYAVTYVFESTDDAEEFYNSYEKEPHEMVIQGGNSVSVSASEEFTSEEEKASYSEAKLLYESIGMICK